MMNQFYQQNNPLMPIRRATEPVTLAPTASMIDPNLENHRIQHSQLSPRYGGIPMGNQMIMTNQGSAGQMQNHANANIVQNQGNGSQLQTHTNVNNMQQNHSSSNGNIQTHGNGHTTPTFQRNQHSGPPERGLPLRDVNDLSIDDSYVQFVLYCNPSVPVDVDTMELRKGFRAPPKSDGKNFSPFTLYQLIARLEAKDIKTWTELVIELGVSPPDPTKNQSTQKVQQYAVRLKRWLHAFHVDAFFKYLSNIPTPYLTERPLPDDALIERDSIPPEEDLALRALLPEWRPKRGRRKAEDIESEDLAAAASKKQHTRSSSTDFTSMFEESYSAAPTSAMPWSAQPQQADPWAAAQVAIAPKTPNTGQAPTTNQLGAQIVQPMRWRFTNSENPSSPYPQSAITPRHTFSTSPSFDEPKSAHPSTTNSSKSPSRARRRHGPAVSSAWPSTTSTASGKLRGRPPSNRSVQDGPFSTFPANPSGKDGANANSSTGTPAQESPTPSREATPNTQSNITFIQTPTLSNPSLPKKGSKLQLQVPEHSGGPVRLATPPRVLINGESNGGARGHGGHERRSSADFFNQLDEVEEEDGMVDEEEDVGVDWKRRALALKRKLVEKEEELRAMKRRVLDAVM